MDEEEEDEEQEESSDDEDAVVEDMDQELEKPYPEECRVLDIMKEKYLEAVRFFSDTNDKKQLNLAIKEHQTFCSFYHEKMTKYLEFDPLQIEDDIYTRLPEECKELLTDPLIVRQLLLICRRKAANILEDEDISKMLNFQMFQYAMKVFQKEKKKEMQR